MYHFLIPLNSSFSVSVVLFVADPAVYLCVELSSCRFATFLFWSVFVSTCFKNVIVCVFICISCQFDCSCVVVFKCKLTVSYIGFLNDTVVDWVMYVFCSLENSFSLIRKSYCCVCYVCFRKNNGHWRMYKFHVRVSEIKSKNRKKTISLI